MRLRSVIRRVMHAHRMIDDSSSFHRRPVMVDRRPMARQHHLVLRIQIQLPLTATEVCMMCQIELIVHQSRMIIWMAHLTMA